MLSKVLREKSEKEYLERDKSNYLIVKGKVILNSDPLVILNNLKWLKELKANLIPLKLPK